MNFSKPRNSTICNRACCTRLASSSSRVTLPWPSTRETGSMATRRSFSGWAAVSSSKLMSLPLASVVMEQAVPQRRRTAVDEVGEKFPDGVGRRRAAGDEVVDAHDLVDGVHLVERQRQFRVIGDGARGRQPGARSIDLFEDVAQV